MALVVLCTTSSETESRKLASLILEQKLAACVNVVSGIHSLFFWEGRLEEESESLMVIKTSETQYPKLEKILSEAHSYDLPEIIALPITQGSQAYLDWIEKSTKGS